MTKARSKIFAIAGLALVFVLAFSIAFALMRPFGTAEAYESYFEIDADKWEDDVFTDFSAGIYWYKSGETIPKMTNPVDKSKPTLIFAHGLKYNEGYQERDLLSLWFQTNSLFTSKGYSTFELETAYFQTLIDAGYNVGQFYWSQLSDDALDCDKKIWSSKGPYGMRYFVNDGAGNRVQGDSSKDPDKSVSMIFGDAIHEALGNDYALDLHLVGHSMGGQLVLATGEYLSKQQEKGNFGDHLVPSQVTLIDPYFGMTKISADEELPIDHLDGKLAKKNSMLCELAADAMETLARHNVAIDAYGGQQIIYRLFATISGTLFTYDENGNKNSKEVKTQLTNEYNENMISRLSRYCVWTYLNSLANKYGGESHCMIIDYYFSTMYETTIAKDNYGVEVPSAKATKEYILSLIGKAFTQSLAVSGANPFYMHNSAYTRTNANYEEVSVEYTSYVAPPPANVAENEINASHDGGDIMLAVKIAVPIAVGVVVVGIVVASVIIIKKRGAK